MVAQYKQLRATVQNGLLYRLISPVGGSENSVTESVSRDGNEAAVFAFLHSSLEGESYPQIYIRGLEPGKEYSIHALDGNLTPRTPQQASGDYWMHHGVGISLRGDFQAALFTPEQENP
jgi:alpha-galactosidase